MIPTENYQLLSEQRQNRIFQAITLQKPDRIPVILEYAGFAARVTQTPLSDFSRSIPKSVELMIRAFQMVGDADAVNYGLYTPYGLSYLWMSKVRVPGVDLPEDAACQVVESELMATEDYDKLIRALGPDGFILHSGCDIPMDAQLANVQAMVSAVKST
jgi:hypothetical protein